MEHCVNSRTALPVFRGSFLFREQRIHVPFELVQTLFLTWIEGSETLGVGIHPGHQTLTITGTQLRIKMSLVQNLPERILASGASSRRRAPFLVACHDMILQAG